MNSFWSPPVSSSSILFPSFPTLARTYPAKSANNFMRLQRAFIYIAIKKIREQTEHRATLFAILNFAAGETLAHSTIINICSQLTQAWERVACFTGEIICYLENCLENCLNCTKIIIIITIREKEYLLISMGNDYPGGGRVIKGLYSVIFF